MTEWQRPIIFALMAILVIGVFFLELVVKRRVFAAPGLSGMSADENRFQRLWALGLFLCFSLVLASWPRPSTAKPMYSWKRKSMHGGGAEPKELLKKAGQSGPEAGQKSP